MRKWLTPEREALIVELYEKHHNMKAVANEIGKSVKVVYNALEHQGVKRDGNRPEHRKKPKPSGPRCRSRKYCPALITILFKSFGWGAVQIAEATGYKPQGIRNVLVKRGLIEREVAPKNKLDLDQIEHEYVDLGMTSYALGKKYGVNPGSISKWMRERGVSVGKGSRSSNGGKARAEVMNRRRAERFEAVSDKVEVVSSDSLASTTVRCKTCGRTFYWDHKRMWDMDVPCPHCRGTDNESRHMAKMQRKRERKQQREAAREWRMSVPRVCKVCGDPFWSEYDTTSYCSDSCRRRATNRRSSLRKRRAGARASNYRSRMRVAITPETYDPSVTLDAVYKRFHGKCAECGCKTVRSKHYNPRLATLDHIIALGNNGTHTWDNVQLLCSDCNSRKRDLGQMRMAI